LQCASPSQEPQGRICRPGIVISSEQVGHGDPKDFGNLCETGGADAGHTFLAFLDLLKCDAERFPKGGLGHPHRQPLNADTLASLAKQLELSPNLGDEEGRRQRLELAL
jgi:hypothetical protein